MYRLAAVAVLALTVLLAACKAETQPATGIRPTQATLNGLESWTAGDGPGEFWFELAPAGGGWSGAQQVGRTSYPRLNDAGSAPYTRTATGLQPGTAYQYRLCGYGAKEAPTAITCADAVGTTGTDYDTFTTPPQCDTTQGSESLPSFISSNPAGTPADRQVLCLRPGTQTFGVATPKAYQTLRSPSPGALQGNVMLSAVGVTLEDLAVAGCYNTAGCAAGSQQNKTIHVRANDVTLRRIDVSAQGGRNAQDVQCMLIGDTTTRPAGLRVEYSRFHGCGKETSGDHEHGIYCQSAAGPQFTGNWLYDNEGWGFHLYPNCDDAVLRGNVNAENGNACALSGEGSTASDRALFTKGFCGFARQNVSSANEDPIHCFSGGNGRAVDMVLYDPEESTTNCGGNLVQTNTLVADPQLRDRVNYDLRAQAPAARARMGAYADSVPGPGW